MKRAIGIALAGLIAAGSFTSAGANKHASANPKTVKFKSATLIVETNGTDGDAGLQIDLDHEPWRSISIARPDGQMIFDVRNRGVLKDYGLTELFSESSEPPFTQFPFAEFKKLFPEGRYTFTGETIDGGMMKSRVRLTHNIPAAPEVTSPEEGSTVPADGLVVEWLPVTSPAGIEIAEYLVGLSGLTVTGLKAELPADATGLTIPAEILESGDYTLEVLAIEVGGNQTITEVHFTVA